MPRCLAWVRSTSWSPHPQPQQSLSHPSVTQQQAGASRRPGGETAHPTLLLQGLICSTSVSPRHCHPRDLGDSLCCGRDCLTCSSNTLPGALQHLTGCRGRQHLGNTSPNPPLCSLKQAFIYAAAGEIYLRICLKYTENYLSPQSTFGYIFPEALRLLSLCRANTAFAGIKLHLCKSLRMPILKSDRGKTSGKNLFFVFSRDLIYLLCIPDLQKAFSSHTLSITILLTGNILLEL